MSTTIKIKRSSSASSPTALGTGELAYTYGTGSSTNLGDRLFIGTGTENEGEAANIEVIGGKYFTNLLDHTLGVVVSNSAIITDSDSKIDILYVDNLKLDGNAIYSTSGDLLLHPSSGQKTILQNPYIDTGAFNVSLQEYIEDVSGGSIAAGIGISAIYNDELGTTTLSISSVPNSSLVNSSILFTDGTSGSNVSLGSTLTILGSDNRINVSHLPGIFTISLPDNVSGLSSVSATTFSGQIVTPSQTSITNIGALNGLTIAGSQTVSMGTNRVTNVADPINSSDAATKSYVDSTLNGLDVKESVRVSTTTNLSVTYSNNILTAQSNGRINIDSVELSVGDRVLIKNQSNSLENGIYIVDDMGSPGSTPYILSRAIDADTGIKLTGGTFFFVEDGSVNMDNGYVTSHNGIPNLGTNPITFSQFSGAGQILEGEGISKSGNTLSVNVDNSSIEISSNNLKIKNSGVIDSMINIGAVDLLSKVSGVLPISNGGTGNLSLTNNRILIGNGTNALLTLSSGTAGQILLSNGVGAPTFADIDGGTF
jgi:hypothetical protein